MPPTRGNILALTLVWGVLLWLATTTARDNLELLWWVLVAVLGFYLLYLSYRYFTEPPPPSKRR